MLNSKIEKRSTSGISGVGLFAKEPILEDEEVWAPTADTVKTMAIADLDKLSPDDRKDWIDHCYQIDDYLQMDIDDTRLMNHSCSPNTKDYPDEDPTTIVAARIIEKDEEITWNYLPFMNPFQVFECQCGSKNCVGIVKKNAVVKK